MNHFTSLAFASIAAISSGMALAPAAFADKIKHPTAVFSGLDKITGRIITFDVAAEETVQFGSLQVTPRACYTRPATETPQTTGFVEVEEVVVNNEHKKIFSGWMFAASPGLHGVEHAVYDVWLTDCKGGNIVIRETAALPQENVLAAPIQQPRPGTTPRSRPPNQPATGAAALPGAAPGVAPLPGAPGAAPLPGAAALPGSPLPGPVPGQRPRTGPVPPAPIPTATAAAPPRRAPTQSFFPTFSNSGPTDHRERDRAIERLMDR